MKKKNSPLTTSSMSTNCPWETTSLGRRRFGIFNQIAWEEKDCLGSPNEQPNLLGKYTKKNLQDPYGMGVEFSIFSYLL
jgi:hypothetical protein